MGREWGRQRASRGCSFPGSGGVAMQMIGPRGGTSVGDLVRAGCTLECVAGRGRRDLGAGPAPAVARSGGGVVLPGLAPRARARAGEKASVRGRPGARDHGRRLRACGSWRRSPLLRALCEGIREASGAQGRAMHVLGPGVAAAARGRGGRRRRRGGERGARGGEPGPRGYSGLCVSGCSGREAARRRGRPAKGTTRRRRRRLQP